MKRKQMLMHYLFIGISFLLLITLSSCSEPDDAGIGPLNITIHYKNQTNQTIDYFQYSGSDTSFVFQIEPLGTKTFQFESEYKISDGLNPQICCTGTFESFQGRENDILLRFNDEKCKIFKSGSGPTTQNVEGYEIAVASKNSVEYSYKFSETDFEEAQDCK